jgi:hypothetical protein
MGSIIDKTLTVRADQLPSLPDGTKGSGSWRKAMALADVCMSENAPANQLTVFVDATQGPASCGESGVVLEAGPNVGRRVLEGILCDSNVEVIAKTEDGGYLDYGRKYRTATPAQRRALLDRYAGRCGADGCDSRYRLEAHHLTPWTQGGQTDLDEMVLLCWFHHHIVAHRRGFTIYTHPETGRIRFRQPRHPPEWEPSIQGWSSPHPRTDPKRQTPEHEQPPGEHQTHPPGAPSAPKTTASQPWNCGSVRAEPSEGPTISLMRT